MLKKLSHSIFSKPNWTCLNRFLCRVEVAGIITKPIQAEAVAAQYLYSQIQCLMSLSSFTVFTTTTSTIKVEKES